MKNVKPHYLWTNEEIARRILENTAVECVITNIWPAKVIVKHLREAEEMFGNRGASYLEIVQRYASTKNKEWREIIEEYIAILS